MLKLYDKYILPHAIKWACGTSSIGRQREKIIPLATGDILEVGIGTGLNLEYYDPEKTEMLTGIDPYPEVWALNNRDIENLPFKMTFLPVRAEEMPFDRGRFDTVVMTYSLCTIPNPEMAMAEIKRVLKPGGKLLFTEHGLAPDKSIARWQQRLDPIWKKFSGGCHLSRDIQGLIVQNGFEFEALDNMYLPGWKPATFNYWGIARPVKD